MSRSQERGAGSTHWPALKRHIGRHWWPYNRWFAGDRRPRLEALAMWRTADPFGVVAALQAFDKVLNFPLIAANPGECLEVLPRGQRYCLWRQWIRRHD